MKTIQKFILFGLLISSFGLADSVYVEKLTNTPEGINADSIYQLLQEAAQSQGFKVMDSAKQADHTVRVKIIKLGESYVVLGQKLKGDLVVHSTRLKAVQIEEMDEVTTRIFRALARNVAAVDDAQPGDITQDESSRGTLRKMNRNGSVVGAGFSVLTHLGVKDLGWYFYAGRAWAAGPIHLGYRFNFGLDSIKPNDISSTRNWAWFGDVGLSVSSYLNNSDTSPFVMGEFGYAMARHAGLQSTSGGMLTALGGGIGIFRTYDVHIQLGVRFSAIFQTVFPETPYTSAFMIGAAF